jgi:surface-anchored protein
MKTVKQATVLAAVVALSLHSAFSQAIWTSGHGGHKITYDGTSLIGVWSAAGGCVINGETTMASADYALGALLPVMPFAESTARAAGSEWDFIGVSAGADVWVFPEVQEAALPWIGFNTKALADADWDGNISITLQSVTGTGVDAGGQFSIYAVDSFSVPTPIYAQTFGGIGGAGISLAPVVGHLHTNFAVTKPGDYTATYQISGTHTVNGAESALASYTYRVIPEPSSLALVLLAGAALLVALIRRWRKAKTA